ncbi:hypothetical protein [Porphyrobacter sp. ULC335]|uniref:hypothetical protein n=1 Tax=Porphyrobacter sp. ULC335 TaxID=2854260 RepID=UPI00221F36C7|nr:hypothetical protein [Porphyrobacter sp. ULC335]UYV16381.1 hypothetical protein KVF90_03330 [Porphyrobacter sp. ULC335]
MIPLSRRRPASIGLFAALFFVSALVPYVARMLDIADGLAMLQRMYPAIGWTRDALIVWHSAWLSIALIPIAMVWLSAISFARWLVTLMAGIKLLTIVAVAADSPDQLILIAPEQWAALLLGTAAVALLFTPASNRWFAHRGEDDPALFE